MKAQRRFYVKIARERTLQAENPTIELIAICDENVEKKLHLKYSQFRKRGEWFEFSKKQINKIINENNFKKVGYNGDTNEISKINQFRKN